MSRRSLLALLLAAPACHLVGSAEAAKRADLEAEIERLQQKVQALEQDLADAQEAEGEALPASLDALYPEDADDRPYLFAMYGMSSAMTSIGLALEAGDPEAAKQSYEQLREAWDRTSKLVPEWEDRFPDAAVDQLGKALYAGDQEAIGAGLGAVGAACGECHHETMVPVHWRYHWGDFEKVEAKTASGETLGWDELMMGLETNMTAVSFHAARGKPDEAVKAAERFEGLVRTLGETCETCHDTEREYYVDDETLALFGPLKDAARKGDVQAIGAAAGAIGGASCARCHHVHIPAAFSKHE